MLYIIKQIDIPQVSDCQNKNGSYHAAVGQLQQCPAILSLSILYDMYNDIHDANTYVDRNHYRMLMGLGSIERR